MECVIDVSIIVRPDSSSMMAPSYCCLLGCAAQYIYRKTPRNRALDTEISYIHRVIKNGGVFCEQGRNQQAKQCKKVFNTSRYISNLLIRTTQQQRNAYQSVPPALLLLVNRPWPRT